MIFDIAKPEDNYTQRQETMLFPEGSTFIDSEKILEEDQMFVDEKSIFLSPEKKLKILPKFEICYFEYSKKFKLISKKEIFNLLEDDDVEKDWTNQRKGFLEFGSMIQSSSKSRRSREEVEENLEKVFQTGKKFF